jgi:hypothetical protein
LLGGMCVRPKMLRSFEMGRRSWLTPTENGFAANGSSGMCPIAMRMRQRLVRGGGTSESGSFDRNMLLRNESMITWVCIGGFVVKELTVEVVNWGVLGMRSSYGCRNGERGRIAPLPKPRRTAQAALTERGLRQMESLSWRT